MPRSSQVPTSNLVGGRQRAFLFVLVGGLLACGGGGDGPTAPPVGVASVSVSLANDNLATGQATQATAVFRDASGAVLTGQSATWSVSNPAVASVSGTGLVTALAAGQSQVIASGGGKTGYSTLTVTAIPVATVTLVPSSAFMYVGESGSFEVTLKDVGGNVLAGRVVSWSSSQSSVASVALDGRITGVSTGAATISATSEGKSASAQLTVVAPPASVSTVTLEPNPGALFVGEAGYFLLTLRDGNGNVLSGRAVTWSSNAPAVATVASDGRVSGLSPGQALITATSEGRSGSAAVIVSARPPTAAAVASVTLEPSSVALYVGDGGYFGITLRDADGNTLTGRAVSWSSSSSAIASVASDGLVVAIAPGVATITATSEGKSGSASITVVSKPAPQTSVCTLIGGNPVIATDGKYLGRLTNKYDPESVLNTYGTYGSRYSTQSIYNPYGEYGSRYSTKSAYNPYTSTPPRIVFSDGTYLWLTVNTTFPSNSSVHPDFLKGCTNFP